MFKSYYLITKTHCDIKNNEKVTRCNGKIENHLYRMFSATCVSIHNNPRMSRKKRIALIRQNFSMHYYIWLHEICFMSVQVYHKLTDEINFNYFIPEVPGLMLIANNFFSTRKSVEKNFSKSELSTGIKYQSTI